MNEFVICNNMICNNMVILHPVIDCGGPNIVLNFHLDWFGGFCASLTYVRSATDRQHHLKLYSL